MIPLNLMISSDGIPWLKQKSFKQYLLLSLIKVIAFKPVLN